MRRVWAATGAGTALWLLAGCARPRQAPLATPPRPIKKPPVATAAPVVLLPDQTELIQELSIVSSPQTSRERGPQSAGRVKNLDGAWVHYGPERVALGHPIVEKSARADVPFTARIVVTHAQAYSNTFPTESRAAHAPMPFTMERTTTYRYEYQRPSGQSGMWVYQDAQGGALIDRGRQPSVGAD